MQAECKRIYSQLLRRSLSYAKVMQAERKRIYSQLLRRRLSYAKVRLFSCNPVANDIKKHIEKSEKKSYKAEDVEAQKP